MRGRQDLDRAHYGLAVLFAMFIALCGLTHVASVAVLWWPAYIVEGWLKAATAVASVATAALLIPLLPVALRLPSAKELQREIAARRSSEAELRMAERDLRQWVTLLRTVIEVVPGLIYAKDETGRMFLANSATLDLIGKSWADVEGRTDAEFLNDPGQAEIIMANDRSVMADGLTHEVDEIVDHPSQGTRVYHSTKVPFDEAHGGIRGIVGFSIDITERKRLAKEGLHLARRTAMGDMAAAIAHEINQPLAAISMYLSGSIALLEREHHTGALSQSLASAKEQCLRAGEIIRRVRSFVSVDDEVKRPESIESVVDEACGLALLDARNRNIATAVEHEGANGPVLVDRVQIIQVVINLVRNALDAIGDSPSMALRVTTAHGPGRMVTVSVIDSGPGISDAIVGKLFEPFVSTKGTMGMGVGLSVCRTIVENHGGRIWVEAKPPPGTIFRFTLPAFSQEIAA